MRVGIVDDHAAMRLGLEALVRGAGHDVVVTSGDGAAFVAAVAATPVDVAIIDIEMVEGQQGLTTARALREVQPGIGLLFITYRPSQGVVQEALALAGREAVGFWDKYNLNGSDDLDRALRSIMKRRMSLDDEVAPTAMAAPHKVTRLTPDEMNKVCLAAQGLDTKSIAARLHIQPATVQSAFERIYQKLEIPTYGYDKRQAATNEYRDYMATLPRAEDGRCPRAACPRRASA